MRKKERRDGQDGSASGQGKTHVVGSSAPQKEIHTHTAQVCPFFITSFPKPLKPRGGVHPVGPPQEAVAVFGYIEGSFLVSRTGDAGERHVPDI